MGGISGRMDIADMDLGNMEIPVIADPKGQFATTPPALFQVKGDPVVNGAAVSIKMEAVPPDARPGDTSTESAKLGVAFAMNVDAFKAGQAGHTTVVRNGTNPTNVTAASGTARSVATVTIAQTRPFNSGGDRIAMTGLRLSFYARGSAYNSGSGIKPKAFLEVYNPLVDAKKSLARVPVQQGAELKCCSLYVLETVPDILKSEKGAGGLAIRLVVEATFPETPYGFETTSMGVELKDVELSMNYTIGVELGAPMPPPPSTTSPPTSTTSPPTTTTSPPTSTTSPPATTTPPPATTTSPPATSPPATTTAPPTTPTTTTSPPQGPIGGAVGQADPYLPNTSTTTTKNKDSGTNWTLVIGVILGLLAVLGGGFWFITRRGAKTADAK